MKKPDYPVGIGSLFHSEFQAAIKKYTRDCCAVCFQANLSEGYLICDDCLDQAYRARKKDDCT